MFHSQNKIKINDMKLNLSEIFNSEELSKLLNIFPEMVSIMKTKKGDSFYENLSFITFHKIDKFVFFKIVLSKLKAYFEVNESFIITKAISVLLNEIDSIEKYFKKSEKINKKPIRLENVIQNNISNTSQINNSYKNYIISYPYNTVNSIKKEMNITHLKNKGKRLINLKKNEYNGCVYRGMTKSKSDYKSNCFLKNFKKNTIVHKESPQKLLKKNKKLKSNKFFSINLSNEKEKDKKKISYGINPSNIELDDSQNISNENILMHPLLKDVESEDFNIFKLDEKCSKQSLYMVGLYIYEKFELKDILKITMFDNWLKVIMKGYNRNNPYHTDLHAADISQSCLLYFTIGKINDICFLDKISECALFLSCLCHDYKHPGVNNNFLKETNNILALQYNDISILENMHIFEALKVAIDYPNCNIFSEINMDDYKRLRKEMISCVLFTDMAKHDIALDFMKNIIESKKKQQKKEEDKDIQQKYMDLVIHSVDISNPTKKFDIYWEWAKLVVEEFYQQGDKEKELGLKCSFDRNTLTIYQNQLGFINFIEIPFFTLIVEVFPNMKFLMDNLNNNKNKILELKEQEEKEKKQV